VTNPITPPTTGDMDAWCGWSVDVGGGVAVVNWLEPVSDPELVEVGETTVHVTEELDSALAEKT
jgi:hypothetical protein